LNHQDTKIAKNPQKEYSIVSSLITTGVDEMKTNTELACEALSNTMEFLGALGGLVVNQIVTV